MVIFRKHLGWDPNYQSRGFEFPKYTLQFFDVTRRQFDIDIAAHYIFYITCALLSGTFCADLAFDNIVSI